MEVKPSVGEFLGKIDDNQKSDVVITDAHTHRVINWDPSLNLENYTDLLITRLPLHIPKKPRTPMIPIELLPPEIIDAIFEKREEDKRKREIEREKRSVEKQLLVLSNASKKCHRNDKKQNMEEKEKTRNRLKLPGEEQLRSRGVCLDLPMKLRDYVRKENGTNPVMVIRKLVYCTNLSISHARFLMPMRQMAVLVASDRRFLTEDEWATMARGERVKVRLVDYEFLEVTDMELTKWNMSKSMSFALMGGWTRVLRKYKNEERYRGLKEGDIVHVWAFRCKQEQELWFAITVVEEAVEAPEVATGGGACT